MTADTVFNDDVLSVDCAEVVQQIERTIRDSLAKSLRRRGAVVAVSGGVDSAVCASLAVRAVGPERVLGLLLPERDSAPEDTRRGKLLCETLGAESVEEDITPMLASSGCYRRRDEAICRMLPDFAPGGRTKIVMAGSPLDDDRLSYFDLVAEMPDGTLERRRMPVDVYLQVVAATNMKQRTRKLLEYYHAERLNYAVIGTPNRLEYELGFFVRGGDGLADVKPIAHLHKTQVYALARYLGVPEEIRSQPPGTGTYSLPQTQEEFYFGVPFDQMDLLLYAFRHGVDAKEAAPVVGLTDEQVERVYRDIRGKRRMARRLHRAGILVEEVDLGAADA